MAKAGAPVICFADVSTKLERVFAFHPAKVVDPVMDRSHSRSRVLLVRGVVNEPKPYVVGVTVATLRKRLASVAVMHVVYEGIANDPGMSDGEAHRVIPLVRRGSVGISRLPAPCVILHAGTDKH